MSSQPASTSTVQRRRRRLGRVVVAPAALGTSLALGALGLAAGAAVGEPIAVGATGGTTHCVQPAVVLNLGAGAGAVYTVPDGDWLLTSWSAANPNGHSGAVTLVVARPTPTPDELLVVGTGEPRTIPRSRIATSQDLAEPIAVQGGDVVGVWSAANGPCGDRQSNTPLYGVSTPTPGAGEVVTVHLITDARANMAATLLPDEPEPNLPPDCAAATPSGNELWPVNGRFVDIAVTGVTDPEGGEVSLRSTGVVSDEPATGPGRAGFEADAVLGDGGHVQLRAERLGRGDGRVYRVAFTASDPAGATCEGEVVVRVDHDRRNDGAASDDGQRHDVVRGPGA